MSVIERAAAPMSEAMQAVRSRVDAASPQQRCCVFCAHTVLVLFGGFAFQLWGCLCKSDKGFR